MLWRVYKTDGGGVPQDTKKAASGSQTSGL